MSSPSDYVSVEDAGKLLGVSSRTVRNWIASGKLPAISGNRGRLVARADVLRIGTLTGKVPEGAESVSVSERSSDTSSAELPETPSVASIVAVRSQLEAIRDEWLAPLIAQITDQAETIGRLEAERDQARQSAEAAIAVRDQLQEERDELVAIREALRGRLSELERIKVESLAHVVSAPETDADAATGVPWWMFWKR